MTEPDETQVIDNDGDSHKYFHQMLNMADDDLDPYEYRLLGHYIRVGKCKQGLAKIAKTTRMSKAKVIETRAALETKGYITSIVPTIEDARKGKTVHTTVVDRWAENVARYAKSSNNSYQPSQNTYQLGGKNQNRKNNSSKKNHEEDNPPNGEFTALIKAWLDVSRSAQVNPYGNKTNRKQAQALYGMGITADDVTAYCNELLAQPFWLQQGVKFDKVANGVGSWKEHRTRNGHETDTPVSQWDTDNEPIREGVDYT